MTRKLTKKGTITIPAEVRRHLGLKPGMHLYFVLDEKTGEYTIKSAGS